MPGLVLPLLFAAARVISRIVRGPSESSEEDPKEEEDPKGAVLTDAEAHEAEERADECVIAVCANTVGWSASSAVLSMIQIAAASDAGASHLASLLVAMALVLVGGVVTGSVKPELQMSSSGGRPALVSQLLQESWGLWAGYAMHEGTSALVHLWTPSGQALIPAVHACISSVIASLLAYIVWLRSAVAMRTRRRTLLLAWVPFSQRRADAVAQFLIQATTLSVGFSWEETSHGVQCLATRGRTGLMLLFTCGVQILLCPAVLALLRLGERQKEALQRPLLPSHRTT